MTYVAKVALDGYDVKTASPEQLAITSQFPPLKARLGRPNPHDALLRVNFTARVTQNVTHTVYSIPHEYGYIPLTLGNITFNNGAGTEITGLGYAGIGANLSIEAYCNATNFIVTIYDNFNWTSSSAWLEVSYYIFAENGS